MFACAPTGETAEGTNIPVTNTRLNGLVVWQVTQPTGIGFPFNSTAEVG